MLVVLAAVTALPAFAGAFDNCNDGVCVLKHDDCSETGTINGMTCTSDPDWFGEP
jgi:hypothetical protein